MSRPAMHGRHQRWCRATDEKNFEFEGINVHYRKAAFRFPRCMAQATDSVVQRRVESRSARSSRWVRESDASQGDQLSPVGHCIDA
jgi:hypothetical protein